MTTCHRYKHARVLLSSDKINKPYNLSNHLSQGEIMEMYGKIFDIQLEEYL